MNILNLGNTEKKQSIITGKDLYHEDTLGENEGSKYFAKLNYKALAQLEQQAIHNPESAQLFFQTLVKNFSKEDGRYLPTSPEARQYNIMTVNQKIEHFISKIRKGNIEHNISKEQSEILWMLTSMTITTQREKKIQESQGDLHETLTQ